MKYQSQKTLAFNPQLSVIQISKNVMKGYVITLNQIPKKLFSKRLSNLIIVSNFRNLHGYSF